MKKEEEKKENECVHKWVLAGMRKLSLCDIVAIIFCEKCGEFRRHIE